MARQGLSLRHRLRHTLRAARTGMPRYVGNRPWVAGVAGTLVALAMSILTAVEVGEGRREMLDHARQTSQNLVSIISADLARNVEIYSLSLQSMVDAARDPVTWTLPVPARQAMLFDRATTAAYLGGAYVVGADGEVAAAQYNGANTTVHLEDREYFQVQQRNPAAGLYFSHPFMSRLRGGEQSIALTRRIDDAQGRFAGIALLAIRIEYFQRLLDRIDTGEQGSVFIVMADGTVLARKPFEARAIGANVAKLPIFAPMTVHDSGTYVSVSPLDGVRRIFTYTHVPGTPLIVAIAPAVDDVLAPWLHRSHVAAVLTVAFGAVFVLVSWLLAFALRDKLRAQAALLRLAATDPLSGLSNRRVLDKRLDDEWMRARRDNKPLSVLFIDIDHFKRFNDTYGHESGDEVLVAVADCIASVARRSVDLVARYGGEEFAVVLPDTTAQGAFAVAEQIRRRVENRVIVPGHDAPQAVTVSVGCATALPTATDVASGLELLAAADAQLYVAKNAGRNRTSSAQWDEYSAAQGASSTGAAL
ncbi:sensor domain-containing diguanylate cyclase [Paraburkholderia sp. UYCP14C]|uniref:diguanylate cyclase n=1 Tax=Paraburkholderia sp. UYCP14C TaxID=2511130 RepID=UPI0010221741|nr:diguanylate cyclase [Paraburkholderia sp. UYCP14C]RZF30641.1 sensor domain-containing diguanylate cyclase [Paraburkholderia sp. UYCP14C]